MRRLSVSSSSRRGRVGRNAPSSGKIAGASAVRIFVIDVGGGEGFDGFSRQPQGLDVANGCYRSRAISHKILNLFTPSSYACVNVVLNALAAERLPSKFFLEFEDCSRALARVR